MTCLSSLMFGEKGKKLANFDDYTPSFRKSGIISEKFRKCDMMNWLIFPGFSSNLTLAWMPKPFFVRSLKSSQIEPYLNAWILTDVEVCNFCGLCDFYVFEGKKYFVLNCCLFF